MINTTQRVVFRLPNWVAREYAYSYGGLRNFALLPRLGELTHDATLASRGVVGMDDALARGLVEGADRFAQNLFCFVELTVSN